MFIELFAAFLSLFGFVTPAPSPVSMPVSTPQVLEAAVIPQSKELAPNKPRNLYKVNRIIDGDTIEIDKLGTIRLIGIDTPETVDPRKKIECFGQEASKFTKSLLENATVYIETDTTQGERDKYGRLLAYLYRSDELFINREIIKQGYGYEYTYNLPYKFKDEFIEQQRTASSLGLGLWGNNTCNGMREKPKPEQEEAEVPPPTPKKVSPPPAPKPKPKPVTPKPSYACNCKKTCSQLSCAEAQFQLKQCGCKARDADKDGVACDAQCQ